jgi:hypothetical protein
MTQPWSATDTHTPLRTAISMLTRSLRHNLFAQLAENNMT